MTFAVSYTSQPELEPYVLSDAAKRRYKKQLAYEGEFEKGDLKFSLTAGLFKHWVSLFRKFKEKGIKVPLYVEHPSNPNGDPEKNRGLVDSLELGVDAKGRQSLYGYCDFRDEDAEKLAKTTCCSVFAPNTWKDGTGEEHVWPLRHVALTDSPVLPGLEGFQAISASFVAPTKKKEVSMSLATLAEKLGMPAADKEEAEIEANIVTAFADIKKELEELKAEVGDETEGEDTEEEPPVSAALIDVYRENRTSKIDRLVEQGKITPAVAKSLKKSWTTDAAISLAHGDKGATQQFTELMASLSENEPVVSFREKSGGQAVSLSKTKVDADNNPLVANAERRAKESQR